MLVKISSLTDGQIQQTQHNKSWLFRCRRVLLAWNAVVLEELTEKQIVADNLYSHLLIKKCFADWRKVSFLTHVIC